jgi:hypothetical protein
MEIPPEDGGLAHTDVTGNSDKTLSFFYAVCYCCEGLLMTRAEVEKLRIRCDVKGLFPETVER